MIEKELYETVKRQRVDVRRCTDMKRYKLLRLVLKSRCINYEYLGQYALDGMNKASIAERFSGRLQWKLKECYAVLHVLRLPPSALPRLFPPDGLGEITEEDREEYLWGIGGG